MSKTTNLLHFLAKYGSLWNIKTNSLSHFFHKTVWIVENLEWIGMTDWMNLLCWYIFIINPMRSCNERTTLHCVESYLYYIILVNKKIFSYEWNEGEKNRQYIYIVENIKFLYTSFSYPFRSEWKWIIYFPTMYVYCIYRPKETVKQTEWICYVDIYL